MLWATSPPAAALAPLSGDTRLDQPSGEVSLSRPVVAALSDGGAILVWSEARSSFSEIVGRRVDGAATPLGSQFDIGVPDGERHHERASVAGLPTGEFVVVWQRRQEPDGAPEIEGRRFGSDGTPVGAPVLVTYPAADGDHEPQVATLDDGSLLVVWQRDDTIVGGPFDDRGAGFEEPFLLDASGTGDQEDPVLTGLEGGGFAVAWKQPLQPRARVFDGDSIPVGDGGFVVTWAGRPATVDERRGAWVRRFDAAGQPLGGDIAVGTFTESEHAIPVRPVGVGTGGEFVVVWGVSTLSTASPRLSLYGQLFDGAGTPVGGRAQLNAETGGDRGGGAVARLADDTFLVAWEAQEIFYNPGGFDGIEARLWRASFPIFGDGFDEGTLARWSDWVGG